MKSEGLKGKRGNENRGGREEGDRRGSEEGDRRGSEEEEEVMNDMRLSLYWLK